MTLNSEEQKAFDALEDKLVFKWNYRTKDNVQRAKYIISKATFEKSEKDLNKNQNLI